jgi:hypothetical protein
MSLPRQPQPAKLIISAFMRRTELLRGVAELMSAEFGPIDMVSPWLPFDKTDYYRSEMGGPLFRRLVAFRGLVDQEGLASFKHFTNQIEARYSREGHRTVNLDPGYLLAERFVLATGKNYTHRILLGEGIYADLTLVYRDGAYRALEWTYPDYAGEDIRAFLDSARVRYLFEMRKTREGQ